MARIEQIEKRKLKEKHYIDDVTGKNIAVFTIHDQHYEDENNTLQDVDESFVDDGLDGFSKKCNKTKHTLRVGNGGTRRWYPRRNITTEYIDIVEIQYFDNIWRKLNLPNAVWKANVVDWDLSNVYASIANTWRQVKTSFILKDNTAPTRLRFQIVLVGLTLDTSVSRWEVKSGTEVVGYLDSPTAYDALNSSVPVTATYSGGYVEWSVDTTGKTFPIDVDPTFTDGPSGDTNTAFDTQLDYSEPVTNYYSTSLGVRALPSIYAIHSLLKFSLSSISSSATCDSATLYIYRSNEGGSGFTFTLREILVDNSGWTETGATWNTKDGTNYWVGDTGENGGSDAGCSVVGTDVSSTSIGSFSTPNGGTDAEGTEYTCSLTTSLVENWFGTANDGFTITSSNEYVTARFNSSDSPTTGYRPKLVVQYTSAITLVTNDSNCTVQVDSITLTYQTPTKLNPIADTVDGSWTNEAGNNTNLYDSLNEDVYSDTDYIQSETNPSSSVAVVKLEAGTDPESSVGHALKFRIAKFPSNASSVNFTIQLRQGYVNEGSLGTLIGEWSYTNISSDFTTKEASLSSTQADSITDYTNLYLRFIAG